MADIEAVRLIQEQDTTGIAVDKSELREYLVNKVIEVSTAVQAYASENGDNELLESVNYSRSELLQCRDTILHDRSQLINDKADAIIGSLGDYGVVAGDLSDLQTLIDDYVAIIPKPRTATSSKKTATEDLDLHFRKADGILKNRLDKLSEQFRTSDPEFFTTFHNARIIVDSGVAGSILRGSVKDSTTGDRIVGAMVEIAELDVSRKTSGSGRYSFKRVRPGIYTIRSSAKGYEAKEINDFEIAESQLNELDIELDRVVEQLPEPGGPGLPGA